MYREEWSGNTPENKRTLCNRCFDPRFCTRMERFGLKQIRCQGSRHPMNCKTAQRGKAVRPQGRPPMYMAPGHAALTPPDADTSSGIREQTIR